MIHSHSIKRGTAFRPRLPATVNQQGLGGLSGSNGKLTEIVTHDTDLGSMPLLMPLLAQLSRDDRWFAWVAPPARLPKALLSEAGIDLNKVILLHPDAEHSVLDLACRALRAGTCHLVVSWQGYLPEGEFAQLEQAASEGRSHGILIRGRQHA